MILIHVLMAVWVFIFRDLLPSRLTIASIQSILGNSNSSGQDPFTICDRVSPSEIGNEKDRKKASMPTLNTESEDYVGKPAVVKICNCLSLVQQATKLRPAEIAFTLTPRGRFIVQSELGYSALWGLNIILASSRALPSLANMPPCKSNEQFWRWWPCGVLLEMSMQLQHLPNSWINGWSTHSFSNFEQTKIALRLHGLNTH